MKKHIRNIALFLTVLTIILILCSCGVNSSDNNNGLNSESSETKGTTQSESSESSNNSNAKYTATVEIIINPNLLLYIDDNMKILAVDYLNDDAKVAYSDLELVDKKLDDIIREVVSVSIDKGYLKSGNNIQINIVKNDDAKLNNESINNLVSSSVKTALNDKDFKSDLILKNVFASAESDSDLSDSTDANIKPSSSSVSSENNEKSTDSKSQSVKSCSYCNGTGECPACNGGRMACPACSGTGYETCAFCDANGMGMCHNCKGTGKDIYNSEKNCSFCGGSGKQVCDACGGKHSFLCTHCKGAKTAIDCPVCGGTFKCQHCEGTGTEK